MACRILRISQRAFFICRGKQGPGRKNTKTFGVGVVPHLVLIDKKGVDLTFGWIGQSN